MKVKWTIVAVAVFSTVAAGVIADTTVKSTIENQGVGGIMNMQGAQQIMISGDKAKTVSQMKMTNKVVKFLGGGKAQENAEIARLDRELFWNLNLKDKEYTELTFAEMKAQFEKGLAEAKKEKVEDASRHGNDSVRVESEVKIEPTGKSQTLLGYKADEVVITVLFTGKDTATGKSGGMKMEMDLWLAKDVPGYQEYQNYQKTLAEKLGFIGHGQGRMDDALKGLGVDPKVVYDKMKDVQGMPLLSIVSILPEGMDTLMASAADSSKPQPESQVNSQEQESQDVKGAVTKKLGGLFGKKKKDKKSEESSAKGIAPATRPYLFHLTNTVTEINTAAISASEFEIPQGFKRKSN